MSRFASFLEGVRIVDFSQYIPGPLAALMLADMGADVIKIEPPGGDPMQTLGPRDRDGGALFYQTLNAGKSVLQLDMKNPAEREICVDLIRDCDVVIEGFRPGVMAKLGVDYKTVSAHQPGLIYCSISGYGASGPEAQRAGHDANYLAEAGVLDRNGTERPMYFDPPIADISGSLFAALAILGALNGRHRTGRGCHIDLGLADVIMPLQLLQIADWGENGTVPERGATYLNGGAAYYNIYATSDGGHVVVGAVEPKFWRSFCEAADHSQWIDRQAETIPQHALIRDIAAYFGNLTLAQCAERFADDACCVSPVLTLEHALHSAHVTHRGLVRQTERSGLQALFPALVDGEAPPVRPAMLSSRTLGRNAWGGRSQVLREED